MCVASDLFNGMFSYDAKTGRFYWKVSRPGGVVPGDEAGVTANGYILLTVRGVKYKAHRVAWLLTYGSWPESDLDHINGIRNDNRISNLRLASNSQNAMNAAVRKDNSSGVAGVHFHKKLQKWRVQIEFGKARKHIGVFSSIEEAKAARLAAELTYHGSFARHLRNVDTSCA